MALSSGRSPAFNPNAAIATFSKPRVLLILVVAGYVTAYNATYRDLVSPIFAFWGLGYRPPSSPLFWTSVAACIIPSFWMPVTFNRPSLFLFYIQYFLIYIPASFLVYHSINPELAPRDGLLLVGLMFMGLSVIQVAYLVPVRRLSLHRLTPEAFWSLFSAASLVMFAYLAATLSRGFKVANFQEIYDVRSAMVESLSSTGSRFGFYSQVWIEAFILPLAFAVGVHARKWWIMLPVTAGYVFLFGVGGAKAAILSVVSLPLSYALLSRKKTRIPFYFILGLSLLLLSGYLTEAILSRKYQIEYLAVVHFRLVTVPALTIPQYFDFFQTYPQTHLSHVTGINLFVKYPYEQDIPYSVGSHFYKLGPVGLNSGVWAGDGLAGFGPWGIPLLSVLCALVFWVIDVAAAGLDPAMAGVALSTVAALFGNDPLFTTLVTGGLGLMIASFLIAPRDDRGFIPFPTFTTALSFATTAAPRSPQ